MCMFSDNYHFMLIVYILTLHSSRLAMLFAVYMYSCIIFISLSVCEQIVEFGGIRMQFHLCLQFDTSSFRSLCVAMSAL